ncbi:MAG: hypothetical protein OEY25_13910, partial [Candidatus Aminicenantes bacterium]|nr:hypothetical protein [Candidatus Aminicenantes bacterium]
MKKILLIISLFALLSSVHAEDSFKGKGIWIHPGDMGKSEADVEAFFKLLDRCGFNIVFPLVKGTGGTIFWHSQKFPEAIHSDYKEFDLLRAAVKYAHQCGIKIHPWLCDFT